MAPSECSYMIDIVDNHVVQSSVMNVKCRGESSDRQEPTWDDMPAFYLMSIYILYIYILYEFGCIAAERPSAADCLQGMHTVSFPVSFQAQMHPFFSSLLPLGPEERLTAVQTFFPGLAACQDPAPGYRGKESHIILAQASIDAKAHASSSLAQVKLLCRPPPPPLFPTNRAGRATSSWCRPA